MSIWTALRALRHYRARFIYSLWKAERDIARGHYWTQEDRDGGWWFEPSPALAAKGERGHWMIPPKAAP